MALTYSFLLNEFLFFSRWANTVNIIGKREMQRVETFQQKQSESRKSMFHVEPPCQGQAEKSVTTDARVLKDRNIAANFCLP